MPPEKEAEMQKQIDTEVKEALFRGWDYILMKNAAAKLKKPKLPWYKRIFS